MRTHTKAMLLVLLAALILTGCSPATRQNAPNAAASSMQKVPPAGSEPAQEAAASQKAEPDVREASQPEAEKPAENSFETTSVPALRAPAGGQTLELLETQHFGALTAHYYVCAPGTIEEGTWMDCLELTKPPEPVEASIPDGLDFEPFFIRADSTETESLLCEYDTEADLPPVYYLYKDGALTALNLNGGAPVDPERIRWYRSCELVYDIESAGGYLTTYLYHTVFETETSILSDYLPYPFEETDSAGTERWILCGDHRALRLTKGGGVSVRLLPDGQDTQIAGLTLPLDREFSCVYLPSMLAIYYEQSETGTIETFGFIDCRGDGQFLNRALPDGMQDTAPQIPDFYTLVLPVMDADGHEGLCVYQYFAP